MKKAKSDYSIQAVVNSLRLLEAYRETEELGVTELSRRLGLHKNNVFRILATLEQKGYVEQCADGGSYRLGIGCLELGQAYRRSRLLLRKARPLLAELARELEESVHLGVLRDFEVVHLDGEEAPRVLRSACRVGQRLPAHCTALGKALLGCGDEELRRAYDRRATTDDVLEARTPRTIVDRDKLVEHLRGVSVRGFALDVEECELGLSCAAAPVFGANGEAIAALSVSGPSCRLREEVLLSDYAPAVVAAAERLSSQLGYGRNG